jgi:hypothetical protein
MSTKNTIIWKLTNESKNPKTKETIYTYMDLIGRTFKFEPHPTRAFVYITQSSKDVSDKEQSKILDAYIENGMRQHEFVGGFQEAISKITI